MMIHSKHAFFNKESAVTVLSNLSFRKKKMSGILCFGVFFLPCLTMLAGCQGFSAKSYNAQGVKKMAASRPEEALDFFERARVTDPKNPDSYYNCGNVYHQQAKRSGSESDFQNAMVYYDLCLQREPNHVECNRAKATLLCDLGRSDEAFTMLETWVNRQPASPEPRIELARLYDENGRLSQARDQLKEAVALDNRNVRAYTALGSVRERMGENQEAVSAYEHALALNPYQADVQNRVAALRYSPATPNNMTTPPLGEPMNRENSLDQNGRTDIATQPGGEWR